MGNFLSGTYSDSDEESYDTSPESLEIESDLEYHDDPNTPELSEGNLKHDEEVKELLKRPENDTAMSLSSLLNFPHLLRLNTLGQYTNNSDAEDSDNEYYPPSHSHGARPKSPLPTGNRSNWTHTPLSEVRLPQLYQPPGAEGYCIPP